MAHNFAKKLELEGDYFRAITEYQRFLFYFPNSLNQKNALVSIFRCYYKAGRYLTAIDWGKTVLSRNIKDSDKVELQFYIGVSYFKIKNYPLAEEYFNTLINNEIGVIREKSLLFKGLSLVMEANWSEAGKAFSQVPPESNFSKKAQQCEQLSKDGKNLKFKNPTLAGFLSIVPGLGYLYDGYNQTAISAFIVNGLFINGTSETLKRGDNNLGSMLGILSFGWYAGNIYGSIVSAERKNVKLKNDLIAKFDIGFEY